MSSDRDTCVLETSLGDVTVDWAWNKWVTVSTAGSRPARTQVGRSPGSGPVATGMPERLQSLNEPA